MPVTCLSVAVMPSVANGVRRHAWKASGTRGFACQRADLRHQVRGNGNALAARLLRVAAAALAWQAHLGVFAHDGHQRFYPLEVGLVACERSRIDREDRLADARGL